MIGCSVSFWFVAVGVAVDVVVFSFASKPLTIYSVPCVIFVALATASESPFLFHVGIYSVSFRCPCVFIYFFV